jgi:hypothetical protein
MGYCPLRLSPVGELARIIASHYFWMRTINPARE